jgi:hypothetical protein
MWILNEELVPSDSGRGKVVGTVAKIMQIWVPKKGGEVLIQLSDSDS